MSVLPLMPASTNAKWNVISSPHFAYKMERPTYCTPAPVENIPANNECSMVEVRGHKVAGFTLSGQKYICLPQAFEYFLKNLVGGLHTVYTKLKRLNISPVVCNVEQVRILRGLGAIQPGVNRCKLITMKDFEVLYQDCTTASRPGRPPKRYFPLSYTTPNALTNNLQMESADSHIHKRSRQNSHADDKAEDANCTKEMEGTSATSLPFFQLDHLNNNTAAGLSYLQQTLRNQYQQIFALSGMQNGIDQAQINPAIGQLLMMSHPNFISPTVTPSIAMLNHLNRQISHGHHSPNDSLAGIVSEEQKKHYFVKGLEEKLNTENGVLGKAEEKLTRSSFSDSSGNSGSNDETRSCSPLRNRSHDLDKSSEVQYQSSKEEYTTNLVKTNHLTSHESSEEPSSRDNPNNEECSSPTQTLLIQIQGLLKLAANSALYQESQAAKEIINLKEKLEQEVKLRETVQKQLDDCKKEKSQARKKLRREKEERSRLDIQLFTLQNMLRHQSTNSASDCDEIKESLKPPSPTSLHQDEIIETRSNNSRSISASPVMSSVRSCSVSSSTEMTTRTAEKVIATSLPSPSSGSTSPLMNVNNNSNNRSPSADGLRSPGVLEKPMISGQRRFFLNNPLILSSGLTQ